MSNKASDHLHKLIRSLTKAEKRNFKLFASRHVSAEENKYALLFDLISEQNIYDEAAIFEKLEHDPVLNNFSIAKNRLYESVLRSLDAFHTQSSIDARLKRDLHYAEILFKKTLYDQCARVLSGARKTALKYERYESLPAIRLWEKRLIETENYSGKTDDDINNLMGEDEDIARKIKNFNDFWNIKSRFFMLLHKAGKARSTEDLKKFRAIISHPLLQSEGQALTQETKYLFHHIFSAYYFGIDDHPACYEHLKKNIALIEQNPDIFREEPNIYFSILTNAIYVGTQLKHYPEAFANLAKLNAVPETFDLSHNEDLEIKLFSSANSIAITLHNSMGEFEKSIALIPKIEEGLEKYRGKINPTRRGYFLLNMAVSYFGIEEYNKALRFVNTLLNDQDIAESQDIHCFARIMDLVIHLELGNDDLIPYSYKSAQRYLKTRKRVYKFETVFLEFMNRLMKDGNGSQNTELYHDFVLALEQLKADPFERTVFEYFDILSWAKSKTARRRFRDVVAEQQPA
ncbi:MAG: hypothetical protein IT233_03930 [Bacteroidia bacterium]|nr:hypothetical protein [Bacteroidia bacterium]